MPRTLAERLESGPPIDSLAAQRLALTALDALRTSHRHGHAHQDLTAAAVLVHDDGRALLTDDWAPADAAACASNVQALVAILARIFPGNPVLARPPADPSALRRDLAESFHKQR